MALAPNRGLPHQWRLHPFVGVVHERVNALARALSGSAGKSPYPQATIHHRLLPLLDGPEAQDRDRWLIAAAAPDGNERVFLEVAEAARDRGIPWMQERTSLEAVICELRDGNGPWRRTPYLTAALWLKGEVAAAEAWLAQIASQLEAPSPEIPEPLGDVRLTRFGSSAPPEGWPLHEFDAFAKRLREGMAQYPEGPPGDWRTGEAP